MYITCFGLTLSSIGFISTIAETGYPPFGLPSVSLGGSFAFLLFVGLYRSAISTAEDYSLRRSIKNSARQELKLLDSIGTSEMERKLEKKILDVTKLNADYLKQQSGIEPSLSMDESKQYLYEVLEEVKEIKK